MGTADEDGDWGNCSMVSAHHKRSKSASDRNLGSARHEDIHLAQKNPNTRQDLQTMSKSHVHQDSSDRTHDTSCSHRASLENDIEQLQLRLYKEKSMRIVLERAMGRASSTLSPGHTHFAAQTTELIQEIESLEEEVTNREQHVLSLYRSIFDQCLSRPPSERGSVMTSPAHTKREVKKHPSIISSSFCSSKKFPLQPFQALASVKDSAKRNVLMQSKTRHTSLLGGKTNVSTKCHSSNSTKVHGRPPVGKSSLARTLKDLLYQCPSELSEELVRCMAALYCWLCREESMKTENVCSPLSRSSTHAVPRVSTGQEPDWPCKSTVEISWISTDKNQYHRASFAINNYRVLVEQLERVNVNQMENNAKLAFWINVYNSLVMHAYLTYGTPHSSIRRMALFHKAAYNIGGYIVSANAIEHSILRWRAPRGSRWFEAILSTAMRKKSGEGRQIIGSGFCLADPQPLVCFALCSGTSSDPMLKVYTASNVKDELESNMKEFLQANVVVKKSTRVFLPKILEGYAKETSSSLDDLLTWVSENVDKKLQEAIIKCMDSKSKKRISQIIEWLPYDTRFRYVLARDLTEKPSWV